MYNRRNKKTLIFCRYEEGGDRERIPREDPQIHATLHIELAVLNMLVTP